MLENVSSYALDHSPSFVDSYRWERIGYDQKGTSGRGGPDNPLELSNRNGYLETRTGISYWVYLNSKTGRTNSFDRFRLIIQTK